MQDGESAAVVLFEPPGSPHGIPLGLKTADSGRTPSVTSGVTANGTAACNKPTEELQNPMEEQCGCKVSSSSHIQRCLC